MTPVQAIIDYGAEALSRIQAVIDHGAEVTRRRKAKDGKKAERAGAKTRHGIT